MMLPSHLLGSLLVGGLVSRWRPFSPRQWALALGFGVAIDLDHALQFPEYVATHGLAGLETASMLHWGAAWQGFMHGPWALVPVAGAALLFRSWIPAAFWGLHMVQDFVVARHFVVWGSAEEWAVMALLALAVAAVFAANHRKHARGAPFTRHLAAQFGLFR